MLIVTLFQRWIQGPYSLPYSMDDNDNPYSLLLECLRIHVKFHGDGSRVHISHRGMYGKAIQNLTGNSLGSTFTFTVMDPGSTCTHSYRMNQGPIFTLTWIIPPPFLAFKGLDPGPHSLLQGWIKDTHIYFTGLDPRPI
jgi:hypothetical protein